MIPIRDDNPTHHPPHMTIALIVANVLVFLLQAAQSPGASERFVWKYGFVPAKLLTSAEEFREELPEHAPRRQATDRYGRPLFDLFGRPMIQRERIPVDAAAALPAWLSIFTCMFLHGGWMHLLGNMLYLWIFGNNVEDRLGPALFVLFYLATGVAGNLGHTFLEGGWVPLVGASGAISGVMGAYILLFPHARILAIAPLGWYWFTVKLPAWIFLGIYIVVQNLFPAYFTIGSNVAYWAHIGGFVAGLGVIYLLPHRQPPRWARRGWGRPINDDEADIVI